MRLVSLRGGAKLDRYLAELSRKVARGATLRVGFLENAVYPDGTKIALVAAVQNFGSPTNGIPPRPFFTNMIATKSDGWGPELGSLLKANDYNAVLSLTQLGGIMTGQLVLSIHETNDPPLSPKTIARKGFAKPLIDKGDMWKYVNQEVVAL